MYMYTLLGSESLIAWILIPNFYFRCLPRLKAAYVSVRLVKIKQYMATLLH